MQSANTMRSSLMGLWRQSVLLLGTFLLVYMAGWGSLAWYINGPGFEDFRLGLAIVYAVIGLISIGAFVGSPRRWLVAGFGIDGAFGSLKPI
ncbi:MAG: hypothetical protein ACE1ZK_00500 [Nitrospirales bacterium]